MMLKVKKYSQNILILLTFGYLSFLMMQICFNYFPWTNTTNFLVLKQDVVHTQPWKTAFQIHVITSCFALIAGFTQFFKIFRTAKFKFIHRYFGYLYLVTILCFALPSGFILALDALGGLAVQICFILLCFIWAMSTCLAGYFALTKQWLLHRNWMIRSFALTLSALSLRTWKLVLYELQPYWDWLTPIHIYQLESWLGWTINLLVAEIIILKISTTSKSINSV